MMTTAGKGPAPSGFTSSIGIRSDVPLRVVVTIDGPESGAAQPVAAAPSASAATTSRSLIAIDCMSSGRASPFPVGSAARFEVLNRSLARLGVAPCRRLRRLPVFGLRLRE